MEPPEIVPWSAKADQGKISSGSISRIAQNTLVNKCTNFGAFMKSRTIGLLWCSTIWQRSLIFPINCSNLHKSTKIGKHVVTCFMVRLSATKPCTTPSFLVRRGCMIWTPSRIKNKTCQRAEELLVSQRPSISSAQMCLRVCLLQLGYFLLGG